MLDVIADFWKPAKKTQPQEKLKPELLQLGSTLGFGFVPQAILSGRRLLVSGINTYQFGDETLTSFVLTQDKDTSGTGPSVSMIVAESDDEYYLAISRRVSLNDRIRLFDATELDTVMAKSENGRLSCKDNVVDFKGWVVASYKREIQGLRGSFIKGDYRKAAMQKGTEGQEFEYTLLVSDSNEHAIEIEKYNDGRIEVYTTVYRRLNDVGEITHPTLSAPESIRPEIKLASAPELLSKEPVSIEPLPVTTSPVISTDTPALPETIDPAVIQDAHSIPMKLQEFKAEDAVPPAPAAPVVAEPVAPVAAAIPEPTAETKVSAEPTLNGVDTMTTTEAFKPKLYVQPATTNGVQQEIKAVSKPVNSFDSDAIECDLRVANKIIDEAIRNEMRLADIVRRIIELPVSNPESVQIPISLTEEDYALLAIRYGIVASDRNAIKRRIIEDLNDFSGEKKKAA